jgi:hypothetical protein
MVREDIIGPTWIANIYLVSLLGLATYNPVWLKIGSANQLWSTKVVACGVLGN